MTAVSPVKIQDLDEILSQAQGSFTKLNKITVPYTTVVNRAQCVDPSTDHLPKFGVSRFATVGLIEVQGELGPNGERVWKLTNDQFDVVRMYGAWSQGPDAQGQYVSPGYANGTESMEITFYGTGLNLLTSGMGTSADYRVSVDGGAEGSNIVSSIAPTYSTILNSRNYSANQVIPVVSGLTLGTHTVKIRRNVSGGGYMNFDGYEVLNANSTLEYVPGSSYVGGRKVSNSALTTDTYSSNFASGTLSAAYGGHVVVYQQANGSIAKAVQSNSSGAAYLTNAAAHTNESVIRVYGYREFSAGRSDDFSGTLSNANAAFTLDDGTTTLAGYEVATTIAGVDIIDPDVTGAYLIFTFVGTGLDIMVASGGTTLDPYTVYIDGTSQGSTSTSIASANTVYRQAIVSGLPYGTHTVKLVRASASNNGTGVRQFVVYGPTKPTVPANCVELCDYYLLGSYSQQSSPVTGNVGAISQGIIWKANSRELVYTGSPTIGSIDPTFMSGMRVNLATSGDSAQYTLFGTGFEIYCEGNGSGVTGQIYVDGVLYTGTATVTGTGCTWTAGTSTLAWSAANSNIVSVTGLTLGIHTIKLVHTSSSNTLLIDGIGIITPLHSPKSNIPGDFQNSQLVGSNAIGDSRKFSTQNVKSLSNWAQAIGVTSSPTTTSSSAVPMPDMACTIKTSGNPIQVAYAATVASSAAGLNIYLQVYVDGVQAGPVSSADQAASGYWSTVSGNVIVPVTAGTHVVQLMWSIASGTATAVNVWREMNVKEIN